MTMLSLCVHRIVPHHRTWTYVSAYILHSLCLTIRLITAHCLDTLSGKYPHNIHNASALQNDLYLSDLYDPDPNAYYYAIYEWNINRTYTEQKYHPHDIYQTFKMTSLSQIFMHPKYNSSDISDGYDIALAIFKNKSLKKN